MSKIIDAVSIVITCGEEIFAIQRQDFLKAFPGYWAFPGGKVELLDESYSVVHNLTEGLEARLVGAAIREGKEELGIDLGQEVLTGNIEGIDALGLAITPDFNPFRFATYFFRFRLKSKVDFIVDHNEAKIARWMSAADLLSNYNTGHLLAVPPVIKVIESLGRNPDLKKIDDLNFAYDKDHHVPYIESIKSVRQFMPLSNTLPPATRTNAFLIGDKGPKILLDPSPKDHNEFNKLKNTLMSFGVDKIFLTHHHPDHHEQSVELAKEFKVPMMMSQDTYQRLSFKLPNYFDGVEIQVAKEGDVVTDWLGRDVLIYEIPGHDEGQLGLAPSDMSWFIAGDLFQGVGTVVIGDDEGDMTKYFQTLEKVIALKPKVLFPSHGIGLGGVNILETTLEHRKIREKQVFNFYQEGFSLDEILERIYEKIDPKLWPFARKNIQKHLEKLKRENLI